MADDPKEPPRGDAETRLAVYGTLGPGGPNHHVLEPFGGCWTTGHVRGHLRAAGWGADLGFPGIELDPNGEVVRVDLLESESLPQQWADLDAFEGSGYRRVVTVVSTEGGDVAASIYELAPDA